MVQFYKAPKKPKSNNKNAVNSKVKKETIQMDTFDHAGNGICFSSKPITIVEHALPNETCEIQINKINKHARFAKVTKVIKANENRVAPFCEFYSQCGGCSLQHTNAQNGLALKVTALHSFLFKQSQIQPSSWLSPITTFSDTKHFEHAYRRRVRLAIDARNPNAVKIGYRGNNSKDIVNVPYCAIAVPAINKVIEALHGLLKALPSKSFPGISKIGHIVITAGTNFTQLALFVTGKLPEKAIVLLTDLALHLSIQVCVIDKSGDQVVVGDYADSLIIADVHSDKQQADYSTYLSEAPTSTKIQVRPSDFLQVNATINTDMLMLAREWIHTYNKSRKTQPVLFDFFCGAGNFSLSMADLCSHVYGFEGVSKMVAAAKQNAKLNGLNNCDFSTLDLSDKPSLLKVMIPNDALVLLDPSREGAYPLCEHLLTQNPRMIIYVSCNPNSFARDFSLLSPQYEVSKITALDMFPYTKHIELMAMLTAK